MNKTGVGIKGVWWGTRLLKFWALFFSLAGHTLSRSCLPGAGREQPGSPHWVCCSPTSLIIRQLCSEEDFTSGIMPSKSRQSLCPWRIKQEGIGEVCMPATRSAYVAGRILVFLGQALLALHFSISVFQYFSWIVLLFLGFCCPKWVKVHWQTKSRG